MYALLNEENICIGSSTKDDTGERQEFVTAGLKWTGTEWIDPKGLAEYKAEKIEEIKAIAATYIKRFEWQHHRADRHIALGKTPKRAHNKIYELEQVVEEKSDELEIAIKALTTIEAVKNFTW